MERDPVGAVDIGTNSTRLLVADVHGTGRDAKLETLDRRMRITRLGQGVDATGALAPDAIARTVAVLREYRRRIDEHGVARVRATATSAARDASNRDEFFDRGRRPCGMRARAAVGRRGGRALVPRRDRRSRRARRRTSWSTSAAAPPSSSLGTTEPDGLISVDIGCVRLTEQFLHSDPPAPEELANAVAVVRDYIADVERAIPGVAEAATLVGLAGTVTTVAAVELGLPEYDRDKIHHFRLTKAAAEDVFRTLATETAASAAHNPGLEAGRVDVIVGGAIVLVADPARASGFDEVLVSEADILDGLARTALQEQ